MTQVVAMEIVTLNNRLEHRDLRTMMEEAIADHRKEDVVIAIEKMLAIYEGDQ